MAWPNREPESARGVRRSPVHHLLEAAGACFGTKMGWERANWFAPAGSQAGRPSTAGAGRTGSRTVPPSTGPPAQTSRCSTRPRSPRSPSAAATPRPPCSTCAPTTSPSRDGRTVYTALLNDRGGYEADVTVTRIRWNEYLLITSSAQAVHDLDLLRRGAPAGPARRVLRRHLGLRGAERDGPAVPRAAERAVRPTTSPRRRSVRRTAARSTWPA